MAWWGLYVLSTNDFSTSDSFTIFGAI